MNTSASAAGSPPLSGQPDRLLISVCSPTLREDPRRQNEGPVAPCFSLITEVNRPNTDSLGLLRVDYERCYRMQYGPFKYTFVKSCLDGEGIIVRVLLDRSWEVEVPSSSEPLNPSTTGLLGPEDEGTMILRNVGNKSTDRDT